MKKTIAIILSLVVCLSLLAACDNNPSSASPAAPSAEASDPVEGKTFKIGYSTPSISVEFCANVWNAVEAKCKELGYEVVMADCDFDPGLQASQCENLISSGVDAIVMFPCSADACAPISTACQNAGIPLITVSSDIPTDYTCAVVADHYNVGKAQAEKAIELCGTDAKIAVLQGPAMQSIMIELKDGVVDTLNDAGVEIVDVQIGENQIDESMQVVENWISAGLEFDCLIASCDGSAVGAISALKDANLLDKVTVISQNGDSDGISAIAAGELAATIYLPASMYGEVGVEMASAILNGEPYEELVVLPIEWITADNVAEFQ